MTLPIEFAAERIREQADDDCHWITWEGRRLCLKPVERSAQQPLKRGDVVRAQKPNGQHRIIQVHTPRTDGGTVFKGDVVYDSEQPKIIGVPQATVGHRDITHMARPWGE